MPASVKSLDLEALVLKSGGHRSIKQGACVMEAVAFVAGEPWSDHPQCACPILGSFLRNWNDSLDDETRQRLKPYIPRLVGTNDGNSDKRGWMCMDWLTRECAPAFMDLTPILKSSADALRALPEITDNASLKSAMETIKSAEKESAAAGDAAGAAAWAAAGDAAGAAAWAAAGAAARDAAWAAARDAAWAAAGAAARDAAWAAARDAAWAAAGAAARDAAWAAARDAAGDAALKPTVLKLQESAFALIDRMLDLPKVTSNAA